MPSPKRPPLLATAYHVGAGDIHLTITIGEQQLGTSLARLGPTIIGEGSIKKLPVGRGPDLVGKTLAIKSVVTDQNDLHNVTSIVIELSGGTAPASHTLAVEVDENGDSAIFRAEVGFTQ